LTGASIVRALSPRSYLITVSEITAILAVLGVPNRIEAAAIAHCLW